MNDPGRWARLIDSVTGLIDSISRFISAHGVWVTASVFLAAGASVTMVFVVRFIISTKNAEIERLVTERNKLQNHILQERKSSDE